MRVMKVIGRVLSITLTAILALFLVCNLYTAMVRSNTGDPQPDIFGWSWSVVITGSMEPNIHVDDLIFVHEQDRYAVNDVITYRSDTGRSVVTHRIIEITDDGYLTQGDANNTDDFYPVPATRVVGKVVGGIPFVGRLVSFLQTPIGLLVVLAVGFLLIELPNLIGWIAGKGKGGDSDVG